MRILPFKKSVRAFSLVELLVVMGIIAILVAVSLPIYNSIINSARTAKCSANMRQVGVAFQGYLGDHNNILPQRYYPSDAVGYYVLLAPYAGNNTTAKATSIFVCPVHTACTFPLEPSYGMNWYYDNTSIASIPGQNTTIMVAETAGGDGKGSNRADMNSGDPGQLDTSRHGGGTTTNDGYANYLFFDGHIEKLQFTATTNYVGVDQGKPVTYWGTDHGNHSVQSSPQ